uniref:Cholesterol 24-hydroxylase-like n=1 Tax=Poecilia latipinna TaxID=48699 RepID=A0A3B3UCG6_9TELE
MAVFAVLSSVGATVFAWLFFCLFIAFLIYCFYIKYIHMKYDHIPGPFFLGHSPTFLRIMKNDGIVHNKFLEWAETYGPVYRMNILHYIILVVTCPEATKEILMSSKYPKDRFLYKRMFNLFGQRFIGTGLVTAIDHETWYKQRRIMDPAFSTLYLRGLMGTFNERAEKLMDKLSDLADSSTPVPSVLHPLLRCKTSPVQQLAFPQSNALDLKACRLLRTTGAQWIRDRRTAMQNGDDVPKDILTQIIKTAATEKNMSEEDEEFMLDNFVTFFIAGQETTANQLAFCIMELARHPEILDKVTKEVDDVIGMKQEISYDDLGKLVYLSQVLKETLRIYPTAPGTSREIHGDMIIDGVHLPGGFTCMLSSYAMGRMEKFFKEPLKFDPDRFHPDAPKPYYCYFPFALGPRSCLGKNFAQMEAKVVMAKLLQRFDFSLIPGQTFDLQDTGTLRPKSGVICTIKHRKYKN